MNEPHESFYSNGILFGHFDVDPDFRCPHGHAFWNYPSGMRFIKGHYTRGIRSGSWLEYTEDGSVLSITEFGEGEYVKSTTTPNLSEVVVSPETTILLEEEFGFRHWFWLPDRPLSALLDWWRGIFSVEPWYLGPWPLPGTLIEAPNAYEHWHPLFDTHLYYYGHLHEDDDSELKAPSGEVFHHRGRPFAEQNYIV